MKNVLFISFEFPPVNSTGCYRYLKFVRHLKEFGYNPIVFAPTIESSLKIWPNNNVDEDLELLVPNDVEVIRVPIKGEIKFIKANYSKVDKVKNYFTYSDNLASLWYGDIIKQVDLLTKKIEIHAIFVSAPPFSICRLGIKVGLKFKIPVIVDFRDDWILNKGLAFLTYFHYSYIKSELKYILKNANALIYVTKQLRESSRNIFPSYFVENKNFIINNGFDLDNRIFSKIVLKPLIDKEKIRIVYSGAFYFDPNGHRNSLLHWWKRKGIRKLNFKSNLSAEDWTYRSPIYFLNCMQLLFKNYPNFQKKIVFEHIGTTPYWLLDYISSIGLNNNFITHGKVSKFQNLELLRNSDIILTTSEKVINGHHYCISSKVFDAFLLNKPIWAFVTEGASKDVIEGSGLGTIFNPDDCYGSMIKMKEFLEVSLELNPNSSYLNKFEPKYLTSQLARILNGV